MLPRPHGSPTACAARTSPTRLSSPASEANSRLKRPCKTAFSSVGFHAILCGDAPNTSVGEQGPVMADKHIDYAECGEYAAHFTVRGADLIGASDLVNVAGLLETIKTRAQVLAHELTKQSQNKSAVTVNRKDVEAATESAQKVISQFHKYLGTLDDGAKYDQGSFFPRGKQGDLKKLKSTDLQKKLEFIVSGFSVEANKNLPEAAKWKKRLQTSLQELAKAIEGKTSSVGSKVVHTKELVAAHESFLRSYAAAKRIVHGLLTELNREDEIGRYFKDKSISEKKSAKKEN
jgi:hypothetical protein